MYSRPVDVTEVTTARTDQAPEFVQWTRTYRGQPVRVGFHPSADPMTRRLQEEDLARHLNARTLA